MLATKILNVGGNMNTLGVSRVIVGPSSSDKDGVG